VPDELAFIAETLRNTATEVNNFSGRKSSYSKVKGYLAEADLLAHQVVTDSIRASFSQDYIFSEEDDHEDCNIKHEVDTRTWILDPICGTSNYVRGISLYTHSLCLLDNDGVLASGIYYPGLDELFLADREKTTMNGQVVKVSETENLSEAIVSVNCNQSDMKMDGKKLIKLVSKLSPPATRRVRILESANLEMAYVACGRLDAYINFDDKVWDIAGGSLMISSAGGTSSIREGSVQDFTHCRGVIATNKHLAKQLLPMFLK
jgi:myo-inositol-1(or 4)-monophosphatase